MDDEQEKLKKLLERTTKKFVGNVPTDFKSRAANDFREDDEDVAVDPVVSEEIERTKEADYQ